MISDAYNRRRRDTHSAIRAFRPAGQTAWRPALPLLRLQGERVYAESRVDVIAPNMFAGSVLDLEPGTADEVQFVMTDPDGVTGESRRVVTVRTRGEPAPFKGGRTFHVYPHGFKGKKIEPSFEGLMCAYAKATGQDRNSVLVDYDVLVKVPKLDAQDAAAVRRLYDARDMDFRLRPGSAAVDRGVALPTITDGFNGRAPDLGALEAGTALPTYGPRPTSPR
jgi:hypothetical protein